MNSQTESSKVYSRHTPNGRASPLNSAKKIAVDHFLNGLKSGTAKLFVASQRPNTLAEAVKLVKDSLEDQKGVTKVHWGNIRQVIPESTAPSPTTSPERKSWKDAKGATATANFKAMKKTSETAPHSSDQKSYTTTERLDQLERNQHQFQEKFEKSQQTLQQQLEQTNKSVATLILQIKPRSRSNSPSGLCFGCQKPGHFIKNCPEKKANPSSNPDKTGN